MLALVWRSHGRRQKGGGSDARRRHRAKSNERVDVDGLTAKQRRKVVSKAIISSSSSSSESDNDDRYVTLCEPGSSRTMLATAGPSLFCFSKEYIHWLSNLVTGGCITGHLMSS